MRFYGPGILALVTAFTASPALAQTCLDLDGEDLPIVVEDDAVTLCRKTYTVDPGDVWPRAVFRIIGSGEIHGNEAVIHNGVVFQPDHGKKGVYTRDSSGVVIEDVTFVGFEFGVSFLYVDDATVSDVTFEDAHAGIYAGGVTNSTFERITDSNNAVNSPQHRFDYSILLSGGDHNTIRDSDLSEAYHGVQLCWGATDNVIEGNIIHGDQHGMFLCTGAQRNLIENNEFRYPDAENPAGNKFGIRLNGNAGSTSPVPAADNIIRSNTLAGDMPDEPGGDGTGISIENAPGTIVVGNEVFTGGYEIKVVAFSGVERSRIYYNNFRGTGKYRLYYMGGDDVAWDDGVCAGNRWEGYPLEGPLRPPADPNAAPIDNFPLELPWPAGFAEYADGLDPDNDLIAYCPDVQGPDPCPEDPENDADDDGVCEVDDNCGLTYNPSQGNNDHDSMGDACDPDDDNDDHDDGADNCPFDFNSTQADYDGDGAGDACDTDDDNDGVLDADDQCLPGELDAVVDETGCSVNDGCPCDNPWKNHGAYVKCIAHRSGDFVDAGLLTIEEKDAIVSTAAESECGHKVK
jgi:parallel beta-helix repeat protein